MMKAFDMHCDTLLGGNRNNLNLINDQMHISLDKLGAFEHYVQCFAIFIPDQFRGQYAIDLEHRSYMTGMTGYCYYRVFEFCEA